MGMAGLSAGATGGMAIPPYAGALAAAAAAAAATTATTAATTRRGTAAALQGRTHGGRTETVDKKRKSGSEGDKENDGTARSGAVGSAATRALHKSARRLVASTGRGNPPRPGAGGQGEAAVEAAAAVVEEEAECCPVCLCEIEKAKAALFITRSADAKALYAAL